MEKNEIADRIPIWEGTQLWIKVTTDAIEGYMLEDVDFKVRLFCSSIRSVEIDKSDAVKNDEKSYSVWLDTSEIGQGNLKAEIILHIPDDMAPNKTRRIVKGFFTPYDIITF